MAQLERDAAIERTRRTRRWMIAGSAALTAALAALVSSVAPGRSLSAGSRSHGATVASSTSTRSAEPQMPALASPNALGLQGPVQTPQPAPNPSGASQAASGASPAASSSPAPAPVSGGS